MKLYHSTVFMPQYCKLRILPIGLDAGGHFKSNKHPGFGVPLNLSANLYAKLQPGSFHPLQVVCISQL